MKTLITSFQRTHNVINLRALNPKIKTYKLLGRTGEGRYPGLTTQINQTQYPELFYSTKIFVYSSDCFEPIYFLDTGLRRYDG